MEIADIEKIKIQYSKIKSVTQFANILNSIEKNINNTSLLQKKLTARDLNYLSITKDRRYNEYSIPKKNGKKRKINSPDNYLKRVQFLINRLFQIVFSDSKNYHSNGFLDGRNILRNAKPHTNKKYVLNIDLKDFFPSIEFRRVKTVLELSPFNLTGDNERISFIIANIVTYKNYLPQGAPTSPIISNIVTQKLDRRITSICNENGIRYSRYADDLTFSSNRSVFTDEFIQKIIKIINRENFIVNEEKTRIRSSMDRQEVTGLVVNQKVNIKREYLKKTRTILNNWEKGGMNYAQLKFDFYQKKLGQKLDFRNALRGQIDFIGSIKGKDSSTYIKLKLRYEYIYNRLDYKLISHDKVRFQLVTDNKKMELILLDNIHTADNKFISFCTSAFYQIENLLNYYYWERFPNINDLKLFMLNNNPAFKKRWKSIDRLTRFKRIRDFDINTLLYLFEKEFYFDKGLFYNKELTFLREIRNDESHRCSIFLLDKNAIFVEYEQLKEKWAKFKEKKKKFPEKQKNELEIEFQVKLFEFLENKNFNNVRKILKNVLEKITGANKKYSASRG